jgi:hypothetical protein
MSAARVTVAGGGLAGLAAALRLAERGHQVKLYESKSMLGGNLASRSAGDGAQIDIYPHMYLKWYGNFWELLGPANRDALFRPMQGVKQLLPGQFPRFTGIKSPYQARNILRNMLNGPTRPADMYVFLYAALDLMGESLNPTLIMDDLSLNDFLSTRMYMTPRAAELYNDLVINVWGIPSYLASASDYRDFVAYSVADAAPPFWLARGSAQDQVIDALQTQLKEAGVEIVTGTQLVSATCAEGRVREIGLRESRWDPHAHQWSPVGRTRVEEVDELVLALPPRALSRLVRAGTPPIVLSSPRIADVSALGAQHVPIVYLHFKRRIAGIPPEPVGLGGSDLGLAFTDISQTWPGFDHTVLALSASDSASLPATSAEDDGMAILREATRYLDFELGDSWGDSPDIDWDRTVYESNLDATLVVNETGGDMFRPKAADPCLGNLFYAGDYTDNRIGMTTIESAVTSGLEAAAAIVARRGGAPVQIHEPRAYPRLLWTWLRFACLPYAASASAWSRGSDLLASAARRLLQR